MSQAEQVLARPIGTLEVAPGNAVIYRLGHRPDKDRYDILQKRGGGRVVRGGKGENAIHSSFAQDAL
jgi:hypothetical protein